MVRGLLLLAALPFFMGFGVAGMFLQHAGFITPIAVFCALEIGACLRSAVSSFSELKRSGYGSGPGYIKLGAAVGFGMPLAYCVPLLTLQGICFVVLALYAGTVITNNYCVVMQNYRLARWSEDEREKFIRFLGATAKAPGLIVPPTANAARPS